MFLVLRKNYESFYKDLESFIEIYINGKEKKIKQRAQYPKKTDNVEDEETQIKTISLFSNENSELESFLNKTTALENFMGNRTFDTKLASSKKKLSNSFILM